MCDSFVLLYSVFIKKLSPFFIMYIFNSNNNNNNNNNNNSSSINSYRLY